MSYIKILIITYENSFTHHYSLLIIIRLIFICTCRHHLKLQSAGLYLLPRTIKLWITLNTTKLPKVHVVAYNTYTLHTYTPKRIYTYIHTSSSFQESLIIKKVLNKMSIFLFCLYFFLPH